MIRRVIVRRGTYQDSARLMRIASELQAADDVASADVMMGTAANVELLARAGFAGGDLATATPMDMVVALAAADGRALAAAEDRLAVLLGAPGSVADAAVPGDTPADVRAGSVAEAVRSHAAANLVSIAVPGPYAAFVANRALDAGRSVFLFSDNVSIDHEVALKRRACAAGLLMMGPDCGTAIIGGVGLGFSNRVPRGPVGIVGASGTGTQEVCCLLSRLGVGVSHAIGTGSRDLSAAVNGIMSEFALRLLSQDDETKVLVLVAKHPAPAVADRLHGLLARLGKPAVVRYLGEAARKSGDGVRYAATLDEAAEMAAAAARSSFDKLRTNGAVQAAAGGASRRGRAVSRPGAGASPRADASRPGRGASRPKGRNLRVADIAGVSGRLVGLFGGGSLAAEARHVLAVHGVETTTPARPLVVGRMLPGTQHLVVDTGDDAYTVGRPHPMVDQTVRCGLIRTAGVDPSVALILLDLVVGDGAHSDPAPEIAAAVAAARASRGRRPLAVVCSVCGSAGDPQGFDKQVETLEAAGVVTAPTAAQAALQAARLLGRNASHTPKTKAQRPGPSRRARR